MIVSPRSMFWVFCNSCFIRPGQGSKRQFFMTSCCHILCNQCTEQEATVCRRCQAPCMIVPCNSQMPDEVKEVFCDVNEKFSQVMKVLDYQEGNRSKLMAHYRNVFNKYQGAKVYVNDLEKKFKIVSNKYESAKTAILQLQSTVEALTKKCQWYKQKLSCVSSSTSPFSQSGIPPSPDFRLSHTPISHSPRNSRLYRSEQPELASPRSVASSHWSSSSSSSRRINVFTPPSKSLEHLSLLGKSRGTPKF